MSPAYLTVDEVCSSRNTRGRYPFTRGTLYKLMAASQFPKPTPLVPGKLTWSVAALDAFDAKLADKKAAEACAERAPASLLEKAAA